MPAGAPVSLAGLLSAALGGYTQGLGQKYQRNIGQQQVALAAQKQASESALQSAQSDYYEGRDPATLGAASARAAAMTSIASIKAGTAQAAQRDKALSALPGNMANLYYQSPEVAMAFAKSYDAQNGTTLTGDLFPGQGPGSSPAPNAVSSGMPPVSGMPPMGDAASAGGPAPLPAPGAGGLGAALPVTGASASGPGPSPIQFTGPSSGSGSSLLSPPGASLLSPPGTPSLMPGSPSTAPASPLVNPFRAPPLVTAKIGAINQGVTNGQDKAVDAFQKLIGITPKPLQAAAVGLFNSRNGTNFPVPGTPTGGTTPMNFGASPAMAANLRSGITAQANLFGLSDPNLTKPALTPAYSPDALQGATISNKNAQTAFLGNNFGLSVDKFKSQQDYQNALIQARQQALTLQGQGLTEKTINDRVMQQIAQQNANSRGSGVGGSGVPQTALQMRANQRMTALTTSKPDLLGNPGAPLVTLDAHGNPSGPGANEYRQLQALTQSRSGATGSTLPMPIPGVGRLVPAGTQAPYAPPLPGFPPNLPGANRSGGTVTVRGMSLTPAQIQAELSRRLHR